MNYGFIHSIWTVLMLLLFIGIVIWAWSGKRKPGFEEAARIPLDDEMDSHLLPLIPTPSPSRGEGGEPSALRATSFTCGEKKHG
jgi:cytochrome c oxidase cbb3-type subunit 4